MLLRRKHSAEDTDEFLWKYNARSCNELRIKTKWIHAGDSVVFSYASVKLSSVIKAVIGLYFKENYLLEILHGNMVVISNNK